MDGKKTEKKTEKKQKKKQKKTYVKHIRIRLIGGCVKKKKKKRQMLILHCLTHRNIALIMGRRNIPIYKAAVFDLLSMTAR